MRRGTWTVGTSNSSTAPVHRANSNHFGFLARELVRLEVNIVVVGDMVAVQVAKDATQSIPIVVAVSGDPVNYQAEVGRVRLEGTASTFRTTPSRPHVSLQRVDRWVAYAISVV